MEYLAHHGILGMHWGIRRYQNEDGSLTAAGKKRHAKQVKKENEEAKKSHRLIDTNPSSQAVGVRQKNGDILYVNRNDVNENGVNYAEKKTLEYIQQTRSKTINKGKSHVESEEKTLVKDMLKTYDKKNDPDYEEAMAILEEIANS